MLCAKYCSAGCHLSLETAFSITHTLSLFSHLFSTMLIYLFAFHMSRCLQWLQRYSRCKEGSSRVHWKAWWLSKVIMLDITLLFFVFWLTIASLVTKLWTEGLDDSLWQWPRTHISHWWCQQRSYADFKLCHPWWRGWGNICFYNNWKHVVLFNWLCVSSFLLVCLNLLD